MSASVQAAVLAAGDDREGLAQLAAAAAGLPVPVAGAGDFDALAARLLALPDRWGAPDSWPRLVVLAAGSAAEMGRATAFARSLRENPDLRELPVLLAPAPGLSEADAAAFRDLGQHAYLLRKPAAFRDLVAMLGATAALWTEAAAESPPAASILVVEDDQSQAYLIQEALRECGFRGSLTLSADGSEALDLARRAGRFAGSGGRFDLVLLDLRLPRLDGHAFIREAAADAGLRRLPVVALTHSSDPHDIAAVYAAGACTCSRPPAGRERQRTDLAAALEFWCRHAQVPGH